MPYLSDLYAENNPSRSSPTSEGSGRSSAGEVGSTDLLRTSLSDRVVGQNAAIDAVVRAVSVARAGLQDPERPLANILLVGPTGTGKTELVRRLAQELRSGPDDLCRIDMNSLAQEHYAASLTGSPPGYAGSKESFSLFDRSKVEGDSYRPGIVLFDEVEKAHPVVLRALLQIMDSGTLQLANGQDRISFRNSYVFLTSNLGTAELARRAASRWPSWIPHFARSAPSAIVSSAVERFFDAEFFNRIDETIIFDSLDHESALRIARLEIDRVVSQSTKRSVSLTVDESCVLHIATAGFSAVYGARAVRRFVRTELSAAVAEAVLAARVATAQPIEIHCDMKGGRIRARSGAVT